MLIGDILYRWRGDTSQLEASSKRVDQALTNSQTTVDKIARSLKLLGVIAGGAATVGLLQYYGVFGKLNTAIKSSGSTITFFANILDKVHKATFIPIIGVFDKLTKSFINFTGIKISHGNILLPFKGLVEVLGKLGVVTANAPKMMSYLGGIFKITPNQTIIASYGTFFNKISSGFKKLKDSILSVPKNALSGLGTISEKLQKQLTPASNSILHTAHTLSNLSDSTLALAHISSPLGKVAASLAAVGGAMKLLQKGLESLGIPMASVITLVQSLSVASAGALTFLALFIRKIGSLAEAIGDKLIGTLQDWAQQSGEFQRSIWGLGVALEGYRKRIGQTSLSLDEFTQKTMELSMSSGIGMDSLHQGVLVMMDMARVTGLTAEQIYELLGRLTDFSTVTHTDFMSTVYAVDQAFRGYWRSLSSLGIQLDDTALSQSVFGKGLDDMKQGTSNASIATGKLNFLMHEMEFVSGKAADSVGKTLPDSIRYLDSTIQNLHNLMAAGVATVWTKMYWAIGIVASQFLKLPNIVLSATGSVISFTGYIFKSIGWTVKWASSILAIIGAYKLLQKIMGIGLSEKMISMLSHLLPKNILAGLAGGKIKDAGKALLGLKQETSSLVAVLSQLGGMLWVMTKDTLASFIGIIKSIAAGISAVLAPFKLWVIAIGLVVAAIAGIVYIYNEMSNSVKESIDIHKKLASGYDEETRKLLDLRKIVTDVTKSENIKIEAISEAAVIHLELADALKIEGKESKDLIINIDALRRKYEQMASKEKETIIEVSKIRKDDLVKKRKNLLDDRKYQMEGIKAAEKHPILAEAAKIGGIFGFTSKDAYKRNLESVSKLDDEIKTIDTDLERLGVSGTEGFGKLKITAQNIFDIFKAGSSNTKDEMQQVPKLFVDAWKEAFNDYADMIDAWGNGTKIIFDRVTNKIKFEYQSLTDLNNAIVDQQKNLASIWPEVAQIIKNTVEKEMEKSTHQLEDFTNILENTISEIGSTNIEPKWDFSGLQSDIDWIDKYFNKEMNKQLNLIENTGKSIESNLQDQMSLSKILYDQQYEIIKNTYKKESILSKIARTEGLSDIDENIKTHKEAQQEIIKDLYGIVAEKEKTSEMTKKIVKAETIFIETLNPISTTIKDVKNTVQMLKGTYADPLKEINKDIINNEKYTQEERVKIITDSINKITELENEREKIIIAEKTGKPEITGSSEYQENKLKKIKEIDIKIKRINEEDLKDFSFYEKNKLKIYATRMESIKAFELDKEDFLKKATISDLAREKEKNDKIRELDRQMSAKRISYYKDAIEKNKSLLQELISSQNNANSQIIQSEIELKNKRVEIYKTLKANNDDLISTLREVARQDVEKLQDYAKTLNEIKGKEYYSGEWLSRARDLTVLNDQLDQAKRTMLDVGDMELLPTGKKNFEGMVSKIQDAVGIFKGALSSLQLPTMGEAPVKPWEATGGTYTGAELTQHQEATKQYEKEKERNIKQQEEVRKKREEVIQWLKRAMEELSKIQKEANKEEITRIETIRDKWVETYDLLDEKIVNTGKVLAELNEKYALLVTHTIDINVDNTVAISAIDAVQAKLLELYATAQRIITITVNTSGKTQGLMNGGLIGGILKAQNGTMISGYGGGDIVSAKLEPGEYVNDKFTTRMWGGKEFFEFLKDSAFGRISDVPGKLNSILERSPMHTPNVSKTVHTSSSDSRQYNTNWNIAIDGKTINKSPQMQEVMQHLKQVIYNETKRGG